MMTGRVDYYFCPIATALPHIREGKLLALGGELEAARAATCRTCRPRWRRASRIPTTRSGSASSRPAGTPKAVTEKLNAEMKKALGRARACGRSSTRSACRRCRCRRRSSDALRQGRDHDLRRFRRRKAGMKVNLRCPGAPARLKAKSCVPQPQDDLGLRVVDLERRADQVVDEVDLGAGQEADRNRVDQDRRVAARRGRGRRRPSRARRRTCTESPSSRRPRR